MFTKDVGRRRRRRSGRYESGIGTLQKDGKSLEEVTNHFGSTKGRTRGSLFCDGLKVMNRVGVPTTESLDHKRNEVDTVGLTRAKVFVHLQCLHGLDGGARFFRSPRKSRLTER